MMLPERFYAISPLILFDVARWRFTRYAISTRHHDSAHMLTLMRPPALAALLPYIAQD